MDIQVCDKDYIYSVVISRYWNLLSEYLALLFKILKKVNKYEYLWYYTEKNTLIKFIELFKSWGYRHLRNRVLENLKNFSK